MGIRGAEEGRVMVAGDRGGSVAISSVGAKVWTPGHSAPRSADSLRSAGAGAVSIVVGEVKAHQFGPYDVLNQHLTPDDRATIKAATGIDVHLDGTVGIDMSSLHTISVDDTVPAMNSIGQIAADRANGVLTGLISADYVTATIRQFATMQVANREPFGDG